MEVLDALTRIDPARPAGAKPDVISRLTIVDQRSAGPNQRSAEPKASEVRPEQSESDKAIVAKP